jgi:hypothetical protein
LNQGEILSLANVCIAVLHTCVLRRAEVIDLDLDQLDPASGQIKFLSG